MKIIPSLEHFNPNYYYISREEEPGVLVIHENGEKEIFYEKLSGKRKKFVWKEFEKIIRGKNVEVDAKNMSASFYLKIKKRAKKVKDVSKELLKMRAKKKPEEVAKIKKAAKIAKEIVFEVGKEAKKGMREKEIEKMLRMKAMERDVELAFEPIVAVDENSAIPHARAGERKLKEILLIDFGVKYEYYCSDISQVFFFGNEKAKKEYEKMENAFYGIVDGLEECETGNDVHKLYLWIFESLKIKKMPHPIGHGIGLEVHEFPSLKSGSGDGIAKTMVAIEPAVYYKGKYGLRFEREVLVDKKVRVF
ncbi:MAG: M24 family metallopeptidase [Candidatus Anstonellales archaeon]